jgi:hypothetical protein
MHSDSLRPNFAVLLAVGPESLPWVALAGAAIALGLAFDDAGAPARRNYGFALAAGTPVATPESAAFMVYRVAR